MKNLMTEISDINFERVRDITDRSTKNYNYFMNNKFVMEDILV